MNRSVKIAAVAVTMLVGTLLATADTIDSFNFSGTLTGTGISGTSVSGSFSYDLTTGTFLNASAIFSGSSIFNGLSLGSTTAQNGVLFFYLGSVFNSATQSFDVGSLQIVWNLFSGDPYSASGQICDFTGGGKCGSFVSTAFASVPDGDSPIILIVVAALISAALIRSRRVPISA